MSTEIAAAVRQCLAVLGHRPSALLTDIDGTISMIAPTPDAASVSYETQDALRRLSEQLDVVGVVTGRAAQDAESMVGVPGLLYIGNHGLEHRRGGSTIVNPAAVSTTDEIARAMFAVEVAASRHRIVDGIIYENKGVTGSIHYRLAPDQNLAQRVLLPLATAEAEARALKVMEGRMVIELRPSVAINKGTAVLHIAEQSDLKSLVFMGDDVTDLDAFRSLAKLRDQGQLLGVNVAVVAPESNPEVAKAADVVIHGVECCVQLLSALANSLYGLGEA